MAFTKWLCTNNSKSQFVKVVHPGGHVELHDRPLVASEILLRNPKCCVAYPHVFQQPWALVDPEATLALGQKYYVVPASTVRKLQRHSMKRAPPSPANNSADPEAEGGGGEEEGGGGGLCACLKDSGGGKRGGGGRREGENNNNSSEETTTTETTELTRKRNKDSAARRRNTPAKHRKSFDYWQPNLESIHEASLDDHDKDKLPALNIII